MKIKRFGRQLKNSLYALVVNWKKTLFVIAVFVLILFLVPFLIKSLFSQSYKSKIFSSIDEVPETRVALVLGAGLDENGNPSRILEDRINAAVELYEDGKVEKIIMSGDNRTINYDEPSAMISFAIEKGVKEEDLQPDYAGRRTYDSCLRAREIFSLDELVIITQEFHMDRAMYVCNSLGIDSYGLTADEGNYPDEFELSVRDTFAFVLAIWDINIRKPEVVLGEKIEI